MNSMYQERPENGTISSELKDRMGFKAAKGRMREIMLEDTLKRLPEVLNDLRSKLALLTQEEIDLLEMQKMSDPAELRLIAQDMLHEVEEKVKSYLDGNLETSLKYTGSLQTLDEELEDEFESEWCDRVLNQFSSGEDGWRELIEDMKIPAVIHPEGRFLGGKQVHRAFELFRYAMIEAVSDPDEIKKHVANACGFLGGNLNRENWEGAVVQIVRTCVRESSHSGINVLVKHLGSVYRRLFKVALQDVRASIDAPFGALPRVVESHFVAEFDDMLWDLLLGAADGLHFVLEPMYTTIDPNLPTFEPSNVVENDNNSQLYELQGGSYKQVPSKKEQKEASYLATAQKRFQSIVTGTTELAKNFFRDASLERAMTKKSFLPDERTGMVNEEETEMILQRAREYIFALMEFNHVILRFHLHSSPFVEFKRQLGKSFKARLMDAADWEALAAVDTSTKERLNEVKAQLKAVKESLRDVELLQHQL